MSQENPFGAPDQAPQITDPPPGTTPLPPALGYQTPQTGALQDLHSHDRQQTGKYCAVAGWLWLALAIGLPVTQVLMMMIMQRGSLQYSMGPGICVVPFVLAILCGTMFGACNGIRNGGTFSVWFATIWGIMGSMASLGMAFLALAAALTGGEGGFALMMLAVSVILGLVHGAMAYYGFRALAFRGRRGGQAQEEVDVWDWLGRQVKKVGAEKALRFTGWGLVGLNGVYLLLAGLALWRWPGSPWGAGFLLADGGAGLLLGWRMLAAPKAWTWQRAQWILRGAGWSTVLSVLAWIVFIGVWSQTESRMIGGKWIALGVVSLLWRVGQVWLPMAVSPEWPQPQWNTRERV